MKKLSRSRDDIMLFGVCAGIAAYYNVDPTIIRVFALFLLFTTGPAAFFFYMILAAIIPVAEAPKRKKRARK